VPDAFRYIGVVTLPLLENKVALITGAAAGIGEGTAHLFAEHGAHVFVLDRDGEGASRTAAAVRAKGGSAFASACDVRQSETIRSAVESALERFGRIDVLINNAGIYPRRLFLEMTEEEWDEMFDINLKGMFRCTKLVAPQMVRQRSGKIVNISSVTFFKGFARLSHYVATKGGVIGLTRSLAREMGPYNVYVNCITPGAIEVEHEKLVATPEQMAAIAAEQCFNRRLQPLDVARVCLFLCSELSDGMTGQTLNVDAGLVMH
jgi:3-oxoacyl-[acyl-carrier protein] reductase